jgi:septal ring factor EnvC (AmiA/AmiB activator)
MELTGIHFDRYENAIPLLADPEDIDLSTIIKDISKISQAPDLKLSEKGNAVKSFVAAGGNHRTQALKEVVQRLETKISDLNKKFQRWKTNPKKSKDQLKDLKEEIRKLQTKKAGSGKWTVILYNEGKWHLVE